MAYAATDMLSLLVLLVWACLNAPVKRNKLFNLFFFHEDIVLDVMSSASLYFAPGLFEIINAASPPAFSVFKSLPQKFAGFFAVYAVCLEKSKHQPLVYIGSGTAALSGAEDRVKVYNGDDNATLPKYVRLALEQGYKITYVGTLVWAPTPRAADVPNLRLLFVAIECAMTFAFWAVRSTSGDYGMGACCPFSP